MNKKTVALTHDQYLKVIGLIRGGFKYTTSDGKTHTFRPNDRLADVLVLEGNIGIRISDILNLRVNESIVKDGDIWRLDIKEIKTNKVRTFIIDNEIKAFIDNIAVRDKRKSGDLLFTIKERVVQKQLKIVSDYIGLKSISTHSFRKYLATSIYDKNGHDIRLVQSILQHSTPDVTSKYITRSSEQIENALKNHVSIC